MQPPSSESVPQQSVSEQPSINVEPAPEGVPALTLHHQYEQEPQEIRTDIEAPREMNGQTIFFDDDHHPVVDNNMEDIGQPEQLSLFAPEEYSLWTREVTRVNNEIKDNFRNFTDAPSCNTNCFPKTSGVQDAKGCDHSSTAYP